MVKLLLLLVKLLLLLIVLLGGVVNGDKQEAAPVLRLVFSQLQKQILQEAGQEGGGEYFVICGYRESGGGRGSNNSKREAAGLWSKTLSDVGEIVLVPRTRQADGVQDCTDSYWAGYDEIKKGGGEDDMERKADNRDDRERKVEAREKKIEAREKKIEEKEKAGSQTTSCPLTATTETMGDWVVAVQSLMNILLLLVLPIFTKLGLLGPRGK